MAKSLKNLKSIFVSGCEMMEEVFIYEGISMHEAKKVCVFPKLEEIQLTHMERLTRIWHVQVSLDSFPRLNSVVIEKCQKLVTVFPSHMVGRFRILDSVKIVNCNSLETIFDLKDAPQTDSGNETRLQVFHLEALPNLKHVWNIDPEGILNFKSLQRIEVYGCHNLEYLFPVSVAKVLKELDFLWVINCSRMKEIAGGARSNASSIMFEFPEVTSVGLAMLPELKSFYMGRHSLKLPKLKNLIVDKCDKLEVFKTETSNPEGQPIFLPKEIISKLEKMAISLKEAEKLKHRIRDYRMHNLNELRLYSLRSVDILYWFLHRIPNLEKLTLFTCFFKELLPNERLAALEIGTVVQLKSLILVNSLVLENIGFERDPVLQRLEHLNLYICPRLINLAPSSVTFTHLTSLEVCQCDALINLMALSTAKSLVQLTSMKVIKCEGLEEIVAKQGNEYKVEDDIVFSKLMTLELVSLPKFTSFCSSKIHGFKFPSMEKLIVRKCPLMKKFSEKVTTGPNLQVHVGKEEEGRWYWEGDLNSTIQKIFTDMVSFEYSKYLKLFDYPQLEHIWHGEISIPDNCFYNLKTLVVENCESLTYVVPSKLLSYLKNLEDLQVRNCSSVYVIFDTKMTNTERKAFRLKRLSLHELPHLKHVWNENPQGIFSFQNLQEVLVENCKKLKNVFPATMAKNLEKLKSLDIRVCEALKEIVAKEEAATDGATDEFVFPCLTSLSLLQSPELKCFYPGRYNLECPMLKELYVYHCGKLKMFTLESKSYQEEHPGSQVGISIESQPLFSVQKVAPELEKVSLSEDDTMMFCEGNFQENLHKLELLRLQCFHSVNEVDTLPYGFLQKVPNIKALEIACSGFKEIFSSQRLEDDYNRILAQLKHLELISLLRLNSIGLAHSSLDPLLHNLESLTVYWCPCLTKLVQSAVSFHNLKRLSVSHCHGLVSLFTFSTARSLGQIEIMTIDECASIKEIVAKEGDESITSDEIIFEKLKVLHLLSLSNLASFYGGYTPLNFPSLNVVHIEQCPRMKYFSQGVIAAPLLEAIQVSISFKTDGLRCMEDDLNSAVDKLFKEKVSFEYFEQLKLSSYPELEQIWLGKIPMPDKCFRKLKTLVVENCEFLSDVIPSILLPYLKNLEELQVRNCNSVEVIFDINDKKMAKAEDKCLLKRLTLDQLPNMKHVWNKNPQRIVSFENLQEVQVNECERLQALFPAASVAKNLLKLVTLEIQNCGALVEIVGNVEASSEGAIEEFAFHHLTYLTLNMLPALECFYPGRMKLECPMLKFLDVYHCGKLQIFTSESYKGALAVDQAGLSLEAQSLFSLQKVIPCLEELSLNKEEAKMLCNEDIPADLVDKLKCLQLHCFHNVTQADKLPYEILHKLPNIETLAVACSDFEEIFPQKLKVEFAQLRGLRLEVLSKLNIIGLEHSCMDPLRENLKILEVQGCLCLTKLVQCAVSFSNLKELLINRCHGLVCLFTSSTAKSLVQLKQLSVEKCESIKVIVAIERDDCSVEKCESIKETVAEEGDDHTQDDITFGQLNELSLNSLSSLACFYTGSSTLSFPYLDEVIISQCPKMKNFSQGSISAPLLPSIQTSLDEKDIHWEGDLNTTIEKLYEKKAERDFYDAIGGGREER